MHVIIWTDQGKQKISWFKKHTLENPEHLRPLSDDYADGKVMLLGLHSAPAPFYSISDAVTGADLGSSVFAYLDDTTINYPYKFVIVHSICRQNKNVQ